MTPELVLLETPRLWLKPLTDADEPAIQRRFAHWEIVRLLNGRVPWPYPDDGARQFLDSLAADIAAGERRYTWGLRLKGGPDELIGIIELRPDDPDQRGFWLSQEFWGRGLMTEAADRVLDFAFDIVGLTEITLTNAVANTRSAAVKIRQGAIPIGQDEIETVSGRTPRQLWRLTAEAWRKRKEDRTTP